MGLLIEVVIVFSAGLVVGVLNADSWVGQKIRKKWNELRGSEKMPGQTQ